MRFSNRWRHMRPKKELRSHPMCGAAWPPQLAASSSSFAPARCLISASRRSRYAGSSKENRKCEFGDAMSRIQDPTERKCVAAKTSAPAGADADSLR
jgi:hypothetical protein